MLLGRGVEEELARRAAAVARGSVGRALAADDESLADREALIHNYEEVRLGDADLESLAADLVERRKSARPALEELLAWELACLESRLGYEPSEESATLKNVLESRTAGVRSGVRNADSIRRAIAALERNMNARMTIRELLLEARGR